MILETTLAKIDANRQRYVEELLGFLKIPSVSTYTHHASDVRRAAEWVGNHLQRIGFETRIYRTERHPVVFAQHCNAPGAPTLLVYGHYDVQPPEPLDEWLTPPFSPSIRDGYVYARGATDDKGQFFTYVKAVEAVLAVAGNLPVNVKFLVEGEEEIGSPSLGHFMREHSDELKADVITISDFSQFSRGVPAITYGLRGLSYFQLDLQGPRFDLHSGSFGGLIHNPVQVLADILARLKSADGKVAIPGFYDDVLDLEEWERKEMDSLHLDESALKEYLGVEALTGEKGYTPMERKTARPTLDVNGIWGGFSGEGAKTIIPSKGGAKVSMRLVPDQDPAVINARFEEFVRALTPAGVKIDITELNAAGPLLVTRDNRAVQAAARAIDTGFGKPPVFIREGGSIPIVNLMKEVLTTRNILMLGWGSPDDGAHSPNERFHLDDFHRGIRSAAALLFEIAESRGTRPE